LKTATSDAIIHYATDGSEPDKNSDEYTLPIPVSATVIIKAKAYKTSLEPSETVTATYKIFDISGNQKFDLADAIIALQILAQTEPIPSGYKHGDTDGDGEIGLAEVIFVLRKLTE